MASTYVNDLRLEEQATGENSGSWGTKLNSSLEQIAEAFSYGSEAIADASTHTITMADGTSDEARSFYLKCTGGGQACTVTLAPNTVSKVWMIENATSYTLTFSQGSGANVAVEAGAVKMIATDGAGSGAVVYDLLTDINVGDSLKISGTTPTLTIGDAGAEDTKIVFDGNAQDFYIGLDDSADDLIIGHGSTVGTTPAIGIDNNTITTIQSATNSPLVVKSGNSTGGYIEYQLGASGATNGYLGSSEALISGGAAADLGVRAQANFVVSTGGNTERMRIDSSGNVGIGETSAQGKLHVKSADSGATADSGADELVVEGSSNAGISILSGATASGSIYFGDSGLAYDGYIQYDQSNRKFNFVTAGSGGMTIDASNNVGINTTSPDTKLHINGSANSEQVIITGNGNSGRGLSIQTAASGGQQDAGVIFDAQDTESGANPYIQSKLAGANYSKLSGTGVEIYHDIFSDSGSSRGGGYFRFRTDGSSADQSVAQIYMEQGSGDGASRKCNMYLQVSDNSNPTTALTIANNGIVSGNLNDTSDVALKENITGLGSATAKLKQLQPRTFDWKQASKGTGVAGFIAQEVASVIPEAVVGEDYVAPTYYADGDTIPNGKEIGDTKTEGNIGKAINATAILAYAVKTIQELEARIQTLEDA